MPKKNVRRTEVTERARKLRCRRTESETLLWELLRAKQLCGLKFRQQHFVDPFYADFACVAKKAIIEVDGGYHDSIGQEDINRQAYLERLGWQVIRFSDEEVLSDVEAVVRQIAKELRVEYSFQHRDRSGAGMQMRRVPK